MFRILRLFLIGIAPIALLVMSAEVNAQNDVNCNKCVNAADIAGGAVTTSKIAGRAVTAAKIAGSAVRTGKIRNGAVTMEKLSPQVAAFVNGSIGGLILTQTSLTDGSGVAVLACPANSLVGSANCHCDNGEGTRNFGILFGCNVAGNSGLAGCFPEGVTFDPDLPAPNATVTVVCVSAVQTDGTPIVPMPTVVGSPLGISKIDKSGIDLETAVNNARATVAAHRNALQDR